MKKININIFLVLVLIFGCSKNEVEILDFQESNIMEISEEQFKNEKMEIGKVEKSPFYEIVDFNGVITSESEGIAKISLHIPGIISKIKVQIGNKVNEATQLFTIKGNEVIDIQLAFAESAANLIKLKSDYDRVSELYSDNIGSKKELNSTEALYKAEVAKYNAYELKLKNMGINPKSVISGNIVDSYNIISPITGNITEINTTLGQYVSIGDILASVVNTDKAILKLSIFEKDIRKIKLGQVVKFYTSDGSSKEYEAKIISVGKVKNEETKTIECIAEISKNNEIQILGNTFINGYIILNEVFNYSLPESSIISDSENYYAFKILKKENGKYIVEKILVNLGTSYKSRRQIIGNIDLNSEYLINGVYNLH